MLSLEFEKRTNFKTSQDVYELNHTNFLKRYLNLNIRKTNELIK